MMKRIQVVSCLFCLLTFGCGVGASQFEDYFDTALRTYSESEYTNSLIARIDFGRRDWNLHLEGKSRGVEAYAVPGMFNIRDVGGWTGLPSGKVYRGSKFETTGVSSVDDANAAAARRVLVDELHIRTELNLMSPQENRSKAHVPLKTFGLREISCPMYHYEQLFNPQKATRFGEALRVFADPEAYPVYVHCAGGADRTGTVVFLLEALCGVGEPYLSVDYELTSFSKYGRRMRNNAKSQPFRTMMEKLLAQPGKTLQEKVEHVLLELCGMKPEELAAIRANVLAGAASASHFQKCADANKAPENSARQMRYLYSETERIVLPYACEVTTHPYLSDGRIVASAKAGEPFGPLEAGSYLIRVTLAPGQVRTRYLAVAKPGWTVVQLTCGTTGDKLDSVVHPRRIPMNYYVGVDEAQRDTTFLGWQRDYGDEILLHLHPDSLGKIDPKFKTLKENWEAFTVPEIIDRLKALDAWMQDFGFEPLRGFASYTPANTLIAAMREVGWDILHSLCPEQNWSDGHWAINHWGMQNQPYYVAADDFRKSALQGVSGRDVLGMSMNSYHLYMPHVVMWGDNVCSPSHFLRWHRTVESGDEPVRYKNFLDDYLKVAEGMTESPYFLITGYEFGRTFGTRSMTVHNRAGCEYAIDRAKRGAKIVFATASDVADWYARFCPSYPESVFTQRDYLAGTRIMDKPIDSGPSIGMEMTDYKVCFAHLEPLPFYHYDYTIPWHFKAADTTAPADFATIDRREIEVKDVGESEERMISVSAAAALPRVTPVCLWDRELAEVPKGIRTFVPPVLDDGRRHTVVELPKGFCGKLALKCRVTGMPDKAEFGGLVTPLWRVQTIGSGDRRQCYAFVDTPLLSPCTVRFTCPKDCRIDALEKPLGTFRKGDVVELSFTTRRTWYRFWGLAAEEIQPDAAGVAALERAAEEWKSFSDNAAVNLARTHAEDDAFFKSVVPKDEKLVLDVDCFGNAVFGERSRARPFDRCVFAANDKVTAKEYSDGGIGYGRGKSFWVHPRGLGLQVEGLDTLGLNPDAMLRIRLCTVAEKDEPLTYKVMVRSGWKKILGYADEGQKPLVWNCPKTRTAEGLFTFDVPFRDVTDGVLGIQLRTNQKQILDDWFADGGFIARLERLVVTEVKSEPRTASFADFDSRAKAGEKLTVAFFGGSLTWSANATEPNVTGFRGLMAKYLTEKYPAARFAFIDASLGGTGSNLGMFRLERDVLSKKPDLVFLDFSCNDGGENTAIAPTCCYEYLLREMIRCGICVQQMFFTFKNWTNPGTEPSKVHPRRDVYWQLAKAYGTPVGDVYEMPLWKQMNSGVVPVKKVWTIDGGHPDDIGYRMFADAGIVGFEKAVREGAVCRVPQKPVFGTVKDLRRWNPVDGALPKGWARKLTYRTSLWYDGLSSRWMGDVAAFSGAERSPLAVEATGNFFGIFGEADEKALTVDVMADGKKVASFNGYHRAGPGRLFIWRNVSLDGWEDGESRSHRFTLDPIPSADGKGEFHVGSICTATIVPEGRIMDVKNASADALEKLDHARGK